MSKMTINVETDDKKIKESVKNIYINPFDIVGFEEKQQNGLITKTFNLKNNGTVDLTLDTINSTFNMSGKNIITQSSDINENEVEVKIYASHQ